MDPCIRNRKHVFCPADEVILKKLEKEYGIYLKTRLVLVKVMYTLFSGVIEYYYCPQRQ